MRKFYSAHNNLTAVIFQQNSMTDRSRGRSLFVRLQIMTVHDLSHPLVDALDIVPMKHAHPLPEIIRHQFLIFESDPRLHFKTCVSPPFKFVTPAIIFLFGGHPHTDAKDYPVIKNNDRAHLGTKAVIEADPGRPDTPLFFYDITHTGRHRNTSGGSKAPQSYDAPLSS